MTDKTPDNVILFPGMKKPSSNNTVSDVFAEVFAQIEKAEPVKTKRSNSARSQKISGNNNTQLNNGKVTKQTINGSGNTQISGVNGDVTVNNLQYHQAGKISIEPAPGSIGANVFLTNTIKQLFTQIEKFRAERIGKAYKYGALHGLMANAFGLEKKKWRDVFLWPESRADELIAWLQTQLANTQQGRINKAARGSGYQHTRGHLFSHEKEYVKQLGWTGEKTKQIMFKVTNKMSRADMTDGEFRNWVAFLRSELERMYGETED